MSWSAPNSDGDSAITGYTVTPYIGSAAQTAVQVGASTTSKTMTGLTTGTAYTFKVTATNGVGTGPASTASNAVTPQDTILDFAAPATVDAGDLNAVEVGVKFKTDFGGSVTGIRFYKAAANTGTHIGSLWSVHRHAPRAGDVHQRDGLRLAARDLRHPGDDHGGHHLRRLVLRTRAATTR